MSMLNNGVSIGPVKGTPYTDEEMAEMPELSCDDCGAPVDSFPTEGNTVSREQSDGSYEHLCYHCQSDRHDNAVYIEGGPVEAQKKSMLA